MQDIYTTETKIFITTSTASSSQRVLTRNRNDEINCSRSHKAHVANIVVSNAQQFIGLYTLQHDMIRYVHSKADYMASLI